MLIVLYAICIVPDAKVNVGNAVLSILSVHIVPYVKIFIL
jgi:hypothetical protein